MTLSNSIFTYFCYALAISAITVVCSSVDINGGGSTKLVALGTVDGKTFFADNSGRNWTGARTFCSDMGMRLATITSKAQWDLLISAYNATIFHNGHWTAARDSQTSRQFTWDGLDSQPSETFGTWQNYANTPYQTCAVFFPNPQYKAMFFYKCEYVGFNVLCETTS